MTLKIKSAFTPEPEAPTTELPFPFSYAEKPPRCWVVLNPNQLPFAERSLLFVKANDQCLAIPYRLISCTHLAISRRITLRSPTHQVSLMMQDTRELFRHVMCGESCIVYEWRKAWGSRPKRESDFVESIKIEKIGGRPQDDNDDDDMATSEPGTGGVH